jgi:predicted DNA-binding protein
MGGRRQISFKGEPEGQVQAGLRMTPRKNERVKKAADARGITKNAWMNEAIDRLLKEETGLSAAKVQVTEMKQRLAELEDQVAQEDRLDQERLMKMQAEAARNRKAKIDEAIGRALDVNAKIGPAYPVRAGLMAIRDDLEVHGEEVLKSLPDGPLKDEVKKLLGA